MFVAFGIRCLADVSSVSPSSEQSSYSTIHAILSIIDRNILRVSGWNLEIRIILSPKYLSTNGNFFFRN